MEKPLSIFGEVEDSAIAQIENVMRDDRVVAGALMADAHRGYSLPIGGVVAYRNAISPSGVGFDIACGNKCVRTNIDSRSVRIEIPAIMAEIQKTISFGLGRSNPEPVDNALFDSPVWDEIDKEKGQPLKQKARAQLGTVGCLAGDTLVPLLEGTQMTMQELTARWDSGLRDDWVFSYDRTAHRIVPGRIIGALRTGVRECVRLTLDNGEVVTCTPDHPFLTLGEHYIRADELQPGISIMPLYARLRHNRPEIYQPILGYWDIVHKMVILGTQLERYTSLLTSLSARRRRATYNPIVIHHRDRNKRNNHPTNLEILTQREHNKIHAGDSKEQLARLWADPAFREKQREASSRSAKQHWSNETKRFEKIEGMRRSWSDAERDNESRKAHIAALGRRDKTGEKNPNYRHGHYANHQIVSIESVGEQEVYDLKIEQFHNFALSAGVFVHNSGNHYVDLLYEMHDLDEGKLWIANHFGSRGFGHTVASGFLAIAQGLKFTDRVKETEEPTVLDLGTEAGDLYVEAMQLAGEYAYAGRDYVIDQVLDILGAKATFEVHSHHNFAWLEDGYWVVRKGATPLTIEPAFIGGSMGDISVIVRGHVDPGSIGVDIFDVSDIGALGSAPHGAGRVMSRTKAAGKFRKFKETRTKPDGTTYEFKVRKRDPSTAAIDWPAVREVLYSKYDITVLGSGADEAPAVYKDLTKVLSFHPNIEIMHTLYPMGVVMAGDDIHDPYQD